MGAFEDRGFIIVGLDADGAQWRFSTSSPSGFSEHRERRLSSPVGASHDPLPGNVQPVLEGL